MVLEENGEKPFAPWGEADEFAIKMEEEERRVTYKK